VAGLWFLGLPWQTNRGSSLLGFVQRDAERLAAALSGLAPDRGSQRHPATAAAR
jgi:putative flavoprotein involved in K+ transport